MEQQRKKIDLELVKSLLDKQYRLIHVDNEENLDGNAPVIRRCIEEKSANILYDLFDKWYLESEFDAIDRAFDDLKKRLTGKGYTNRQIARFLEKHMQDVQDEIYSRNHSDSIENLLKNTRDIPVRVEMLSNYDCINSHWLESQGGFSYESSYFGDMIDALWLNPKKVKELLVENGEKVCGRFPNRAYRDGRELVSYEQFYEELINSSCGANLLTFTATINPMNLYESGFNLSKLTIPKGNRCGLFSSLWGGGSILEMVLERDVTVDLERTKYPKYRLEFETNGRDYNYSIRQVYCYDSTSYGKSARIEPLHRNKRISA